MPPRLTHPHPRLLLHLLRRASPHHPRHTSTIPRAPPAPPRLAPAEQAEFERLQRLSGGNAFTTSQHHNPEPAGALEHPDVRRGAPPEFEGDVNPRTGEVGGPKNDPLRHGDYSFNGRVTDF